MFVKFKYAIENVTQLKLKLFLLVTTDANAKDWKTSPRGSGYLFGPNIVQRFNQINSIKMICRAHQLAMAGFKWHFNKTLLTVWSVPNYCYR